MNDVNSDPEDLKIDRQLRRTAYSGGARIEMKDGRMTAMVGVGLAITPIAVVAIGAWIANSISALNLTVAKLVTQNEAIVDRLKATENKNDQQEDHINAMDRRLSVVEQVSGVQLRGGPRSVK